MKIKPVLFFSLLLLVTIMTVINGCLYSENISYKSENRSLIIQNDSILSVNIELNQALNQQGNRKIGKNISVTYKD